MRFDRLAIAEEVGARRAGRRLRIKTRIAPRDVPCTFCNAPADQACWQTPTRKRIRSHEERIANARRLSA